MFKKIIMSFSLIPAISATTTLVSCSNENGNKTNIELTDQDFEQLNEILRKSEILEFPHETKFLSLLNTDNGIVSSYFENKIYPEFRKENSLKLSSKMIEEKINLFKNEKITINWFNPNIDIRRDVDNSILELNMTSISFDDKESLSEDIFSMSMFVGDVRWHGMNDFNEIKKFISISLKKPNFIINEDKISYIFKGNFINFEIF